LLSWNQADAAMPSVLTRLSLAYAEAEPQLLAFRTWLQSKDYFKERDVVAQLKAHPHLCLLTSRLGTTANPDLFKHEFEIQGLFRADLVAGSSATQHFTFVEFEGAEKHSLFGPKTTNQMRDWGAQLQHALGQIVDWSWALNDSQRSAVLTNAMGYLEFKRTYAVICGRDASMDATEKSRLNWLSAHCKVTDTPVVFMTYDDLLLHFDACLTVWRDALAQANTTSSA
jgi:hypothetical protein